MIIQFYIKLDPLQADIIKFISDELNILIYENNIEEFQGINYLLSLINQYILFIILF